jgi:hypothetical protein
MTPIMHGYDDVHVKLDWIFVRFVRRAAGLCDVVVKAYLCKFSLYEFSCVVMYHFIRLAVLLYVGLKGNASWSSAFSWEYKGNPGVYV